MPTRTALLMAGALIAAAVGAAIGYAWHAPGGSSTWDAIRSWGTFAVVVLGFGVAAWELNLQRRTFDSEARRNQARDEMLDQQHAELQAARLVRERELAEGVDVTWDDNTEQQNTSLVVVINESKRPIFGVVVRGHVVQDPASLLPALRAGEIYPSSIPASLAPWPGSWTFRDGSPGDRLESLRPGGRGAFSCGFPRPPAPGGRVFVRFTDDRHLHWQVDQHLHLERLRERDW